MKFQVPEMSCGHCVAAIKQQIAAADPQAQVTIDLDTREIAVVTAQPESAMIAAIAAAGYDATPG